MANPIKDCILILSHPSEPHAQHVKAACESRGENVLYFDIRQFPRHLKLSYSPTNSTLHSINISGHHIFPKSIYWRWYNSPEINPDLAPQDHPLAFKESDSALNGFLNTLDCLWINPPESYKLHWSKPTQMHLFQKNNIPIPKTLISNDVEMIKIFLKENNNRFIFKPVQGGFPTTLIKDGDLDIIAPALTNAPICVQEYIEGKDIRVYIIGKDIFAIRIDSKTIDFREDKSHGLSITDIPDIVKDTCFKIAELSHYIFTAIDIKLDKNGNYYFLEANPSPMFLHVENMTGFPITEKIVNLLTTRR